MALLAVLLLAAPSLPAQSSHPHVKEIALFREGAGRVAWSAQGDWLAFDRPAAERGNYQLWIMKRDGTFERCLTCEPVELRSQNSINPTWHPSGDWIVFQVQSQAKRLGMGPIELATGDRGLWSELWVIRRDGRGFWQLTRVHERGGALLDPEFSHEGGELLWSERVQSRIGRWGEWVLRVAQFRGGKGPHLAKPRTFEPGAQRLFLAGSSFTPDDRGALLAGNLETGQPENGMDVYRLAFADGAIERLTHTQRAWDERATYTVKGDRILWTSASEITAKDVGRDPGLPLELLRDLWVMSADGSGPERLTFFNHPSARESLGAAIVDDFAQSPQGDEILAHVVWSADGEVREGLYLILLDESFARTGGSASAPAGPRGR
jgi:Tol biopolymer transport system component